MWEAPVESVTVDTLDQRYLLTPPDVKDGYLVHVVQKFRNDKPKGSIIVFTDTCKYGFLVWFIHFDPNYWPAGLTNWTHCRSCQILCMTLAELGFESLALHSMISQRDRIAALTRFRSNTVRILIATDVASRGEQKHYQLNNKSPSIQMNWLLIRSRYSISGVGGQSQCPHSSERVRPPSGSHSSCW